MMTSEDQFIGNLYQRFPINISRGKGARVWDNEGREYIDCMAGYGVALVGHCNDRVVEAIKNQSEKLIVCHMSAYNDTRLRYLEKLSSISPKGLSKVAFSNSGAESVEAALKFARKYSGKAGIIAMTGGYHGKTLGALSVTYNEKYRKPFMPLLDYVKFLPYNDRANLDNEIDDSIGTIILEPIQGETGIIIPPDGLLQNIRQICTDRNIVLIYDEIQSGLGRTGKMWAGEHWNTTPDIMCLAKGVGGGIPMALTLAKPEIIDTMKIGEHSSTFAGNPVACAAASAALDALVEDRLVQNACSVGKYFKDGLMCLKDTHKIVRDVRGLGLMLALELRFDVREVLLDGIKNGILMLYSGRNIIRLLPPLVIDESMVSSALEKINKILTKEEDRKNVR
ncbi:MAG TPA: aspartate aminotransferase family protein [Nitrososphaeraceae archaeon]